MSPFISSFTLLISFPFLPSLLPPLSSQVLGVRARYEKELRGLHEDKNRSEEEIRQQLRDEKVNRRGDRKEVQQGQKQGQEVKVEEERKELENKSDSYRVKNDGGETAASHV